MVDQDECHFTNTGKYMVKYGYQVERVYPDKEETIPAYISIVTLLMTYS